MANSVPIDTVTAQVLSPSLDPYGQLIKMLMPRAINIALFDHEALPLWWSDGVENPDLLDLIREAAGGDAELAEQGVAGFARGWNGDSAYVFSLRDAQRRAVGFVGVVTPDLASGARPFNVIYGMLRPALEVLTRELLYQYSIDDL